MIIKNNLFIIYYKANKIKPPKKDTRLVRNENEGFLFLSARRLNQDPIENHCSQIWARGGINVNLNSQQLRIILRELCYEQLIINNIGSNCLDDKANYLFNTSRLFFPNQGLTLLE